MDRTVDYVILGAGIAGMTMQYALRGRSAVLLDPAPGRYKIGESLIPQHFVEPEVRPLFDIVRQLPSASPKDGTLFIAQDSVSASRPFAIAEYTIHVARQELEAATAEFFGTEVTHERVESIDVDARVVRTDKGTFHARQLIIDCSGPARILARSLGLLREVWPVWASWAYHDVEGTEPERFWGILRRKEKEFFLYNEPRRCLEESTEYEALDPTRATVLTHVGEGTWTWQIPLYGRRMLSVGVVSRRGPVSEEEYREVVGRSIGPQYRTRMRETDSSGPFNTFHVRNRFAWAADRFAGDGWALVGDAAFFGDPVYSIGTGFATNHALQLGKLLQSGDWNPRRAEAHHRHTSHLYACAKRAYDWWYFGKVIADREVADRVQTDFLNGRLFQVQTIAAFTDAWLVSRPQDSSWNEPNARDGEDVTDPVASLLGEERVLGGWQMVRARAFKSRLELEWERPDVAPMMLRLERAAEAPSFYKAVGELGLSYHSPKERIRGLDGQRLALIDGFARVMAREQARLRALMDDALVV